MIFVSHNLYGSRAWGHFDVYQQEPDWWFVEVGGWTIEVERGNRECRRKVALYTAITGTCLLAAPHVSAHVSTAVQVLADRPAMQLILNLLGPI